MDRGRQVYVQTNTQPSFHIHPEFKKKSHPQYIHAAEVAGEPDGISETVGENSQWHVSSIPIPKAWPPEPFVCASKKKGHAPVLNFSRCQEYWCNRVPWEINKNLKHILWHPENSFHIHSSTPVARAGWAIETMCAHPSGSHWRVKMSSSKKKQAIAAQTFN